jgi:aspartate kinase
MNKHSIEKIGGTSMSDYAAVRDNIIFKPGNASPYQRVFVVSAYGGLTNQLLEDKKDGKPGVYGLFASSFDDNGWVEALQQLRQSIYDINARLFSDEVQAKAANRFIGDRLDNAKKCLQELQNLCRHGHFSMDSHLATVREMLASVGEAHSAWNTAQLLKLEGLNTCFVDLTGWNSDKHIPLDERIKLAFASIDLDTVLPIVTGYAHSDEGLMNAFDRGYSEMTFSRIAVLTDAREAVIHKEYHLSSADPRIVGKENAVPIGRTNYDVADQLANLGMEAIHPKAAKGLRQNNIPLRVKNTFEPEHAGTLITGDYVSDTACVEIIAGCKGVYALELFDQDMAGRIGYYDSKILKVLDRFRVGIVAKDINANSVTHYVSANLKSMKRVLIALAEQFPEAEINQQKIAVVSAIGSDMQVTGILAKTAAALASSNISVLAMHQSIRQVDMQFIVKETDYELAIQSLHQCLVETHDHGRAICLAS